MPALTFDVLYLHDAADLTDSIELVLDGEVIDLAVPGEVRTMANGRRRAVFRAGVARAFQATCDFVDPSDRQTFETWVSGHTLLLFREPRGRVAWGHAFATSTTEKPANDEALVTFTFETITYSEEV